MKELPAIIIRELYLMGDSKRAIIESFIAPFFYLVFFIPAIAHNMGSMTLGITTVSYIEFVLPGLILFNFFNNGQYAAVNLYIDKTSGEVETLFSLPLSRSMVVMGYAISSIIKSFLQMVFLLLLAMILNRSGLSIEFAGIGYLLIIGVVFGLAVTFFFVGTAARVNNQDSFNILINIIGIPLLFTSTVFFSNQALGGYLKWISLVNPLSLVTDFSRAVVYEAKPILSIELLILVSICVLGFYYAKTSIDRCIA